MLYYICINFSKKEKGGSQMAEKQVKRPNGNGPGPGGRMKFEKPKNTKEHIITQTLS